MHLYSPSVQVLQEQSVFWFSCLTKKNRVKIKKIKQTVLDQFFFSLQNKTPHQIISLDISFALKWNVLFRMLVWKGKETLTSIKQIRETCLIQGWESAFHLSVLTSVWMTALFCKSTTESGFSTTYSHHLAQCNGNSQKEHVRKTLCCGEEYTLLEVWATAAVNVHWFTEETMPEGQAENTLP